MRLNIETYLAGQDQPTHPSVISFEEPWNGYSYWMAYSPYPQANGEEENPSIAISNDLYYWQTPQGMVNPIADNEETGCNELKDPHILYRDDLNRIEVWYLGRISKNLGGDGESLTLFRKYSYDGISWSDYEVMSKTKYLSPSVIWDGEKYQLWGIGFGTYDTQGMLVYQESCDGIAWSEPQKCSIDGVSSDLPIWHGAVIFADDTYHFVFVSDSGNSQTVEYCESKNGIEFTEQRTVVANSKQTLWRALYRPFLLIENGQYDLFYGVIAEDNSWYITMSSGKSVNQLSGISESDSGRMAALNTSVVDTHSVSYRLHQIYRTVRNYLRLELYGLILFVYLFCRLVRKRTGQGRLLASIAVSCVAICFAYTMFVLRLPIYREEMLYALFVSVFEGITIFSVSYTCSEL